MRFWTSDFYGTDTEMSPHRKLPGEENAPAAPARTRTRDLSITSPSLYHWAIPAPLVRSLKVMRGPCAVDRTSQSLLLLLLLSLLLLLLLLLLLPSSSSSSTSSSSSSASSSSFFFFFYFLLLLLLFFFLSNITSLRTDKIKTLMIYL